MPFANYCRIMVRWGWPLVIFIAPLLYLPNLFEYAALPKSIWLESTTLLLLVLWLLSLVGQAPEKRIIHLSPLLGPLAIFLLWALLSMAWAINVYEVVERWLAWALATAAFFLVSNVCRDSREQWRLIIAMYSAGVIIAVLGISQYLFGLDLFQQAAPPAATFGNRNMAIHLQVITLPLGGLLFLRVTDKRLTALLAISLALMATYMLYTGTRAGWLAGGLELLIFYPMARRLLTAGAWQFNAAKKRGLICAFLLFAALSVLGPNGSLDGYDRLGQRLTATQQFPHTLPPRLAIWLNSLAMVKDRPLLGTGLGNFQVYYPLYHQRWAKTFTFTPQNQTRKVHNDLLQLLVELGLIGLLLALYIPGKALLVMRRYPARLNGQQRLLVNTLFIALGGIGLNALLSFPLQRSVPTFYALACLGLISNLILPTPHKTMRLPQLGGIILASLVGLMTMLSHSFHRFQADRLLLAAVAQGAGQHWQQTITLARQSLRHYPLHNKPVLIFLGEAQLHENQANQARQSFTLLLKSYPYNVNAMASLGGCYAALYQYDQANRLFAQSLAILPDSWLVYHNMGNMYLQQHLYAKAQAAFSQASKLNPLDLRPWQRLALTARLNGDLPTSDRARLTISKLHKKKVCQFPSRGTDRPQ